MRSRQLVADILMDWTRHSLRLRIAVSQTVAVSANGPVYEHDVPWTEPPILKNSFGQSSELEKRIWNAERRKLVAEGHRLFRSDEISTEAVACTMCYSQAADAHAETYPKFQAQLDKVALLRNMVR